MQKTLGKKEAAKVTNWLVCFAWALLYPCLFLLREKDHLSIRSGTENAHEHMAGWEQHESAPAAYMAKK